MIPVGRLAPVNQWDQTLLDDLFANKLYPTGLEFQRHEGYPSHVDGCVLLIPSRYWSQHTDQITQAIARFRWVLAVRAGDEEDTFDIKAVSHPNIKWWVQTPRVGRDYGQARLLGVGYTPHFRDLPTTPPAKSTDVFLLGQDTHQRRHECFAALKDFPETVGATAGFTQGAKPELYAEWMVDAKIAPAPSGAVSCDSFRAWEALEAHAIPIVDTVSPVDGHTDYWWRLLGEVPFPVISNYSDLPGWVSDLLADWPANANRVSAWWIRHKRSMARDLVADLTELGACA